jgi:predicted HicB family RNase H-like nuclease
MTQRSSFLDKLEKVRDKKRKISVYLPAKMVKDLKISAAHQEKSVSELVEDLIATSLHKDK